MALRGRRLWRRRHVEEMARTRPREMPLMALEERSDGTDVATQMRTQMRRSWSSPHGENGEGNGLRLRPQMASGEDGSRSTARETPEKHLGQ